MALGRARTLTANDHASDDDPIATLAFGQITGASGVAKHVPQENHRMTAVNSVTTIISPRNFSFS
ncbi:MAG TPA: hypothetical protein VL981_01135 [Candidatus Methylacidiphilales bacterium]|nr:hypothetical protein [Candidatus Methylacidiphilales bacterium]